MKVPLINVIIINPLIFLNLLSSINHIQFFLICTKQINPVCLFARKLLTPNIGCIRKPNHKFVRLIDLLHDFFGNKRKEEANMQKAKKMGHMR